MAGRARSVAWALSLLIYAAITLLSSLPASSLPSGIPDWIPHGLEFLLLAFFFIQVFRRPERPRILAVAFLVLAALGLLDEAHQLLVPGRVFSLRDWLYDMLGSAMGMVAFLLFAKHKSEISNK